MLKFFLLLLFTFTIYGQHQVTIPWPSLANSPWPVIRGDMQATGRSEYTGPRTPNVIWRKDMPLGIFHGPVIGFNNNLFVGTNSFTGFAGGTSNYFYSMNKKGDTIWTYITDDPSANVAGPTITNDSTIYFISIGAGLFALNQDGTLKWRNEKFSATYFTRFISLAKDHNIYIPWLDTLFVIEPNNGNVINSFYTPNIAPTEIVFSTGGDTIFYFTGKINTLEEKALNASTLQGEQIWSLDLYTYSHSWGTPIVDNENRIYLYASEGPSGQYLYCVNPNGTINWKYPFMNENYQNYSSPTIDRNGNIIFQTNTDTGYIYSVDYFGHLNWKISLGDIDDGAIIDHGIICDAEGKIYCGSTTGAQTNFWCIDNTGKILWKLNLEGYEFNTSPAIGSDGTLYIGTHLRSTFLNHIRNLIAVKDSVTSVEGDVEKYYSYILSQNYPNPFNPITIISYSIKQEGLVILKVYNILGKEVATLVNENKRSGTYEVNFNASNLPSGIYIYKLQSGIFSDVKKMLLIK